MTNKLSVILGLLIIVFLSGCQSPWEEARINLNKSENLRIGMTKTEVISVMGTPVVNEEYSTPDLWFYFVNPEWCDGLITRDECMPLVFENGKLIGWGNNYYTQYRINSRMPKDNK